MFDSADVYSQGQSEAILGRAIAGRRDRVLISTKGTFRTGDDPNDVGSSRFHITKTFFDRGPGYATLSGGAAFNEFDVL
jgi:aryl-alcohol dehydrogenase-like predicted oxidoreductase